MARKKMLLRKVAVRKRKVARQRRTAARKKTSARPAIRRSPIRVTSRQKTTSPQKRMLKASSPPIQEPPRLPKGYEPPLLAGPAAEPLLPGIPAPPRASPIDGMPSPASQEAPPAAIDSVLPVPPAKTPATSLLPPPGPLVLTVRVRHWCFKVPDKELLLAFDGHCLAVAAADTQGIVRFDHLSAGRYSIAVASGAVREKKVDLKRSSTITFFV